MKIKSITTALLFAVAIFVGCKQSSVKVFSSYNITDSAAMAPCGELSVARTLEMGVFAADSLKKETTLAYWNVGNDTLYISSILPDCDCTEVLGFDSKIAPGKKGEVRVALDLTSYPCDTIRKDIGILSSDRHDREKRVTLIGLRK